MAACARGCHETAARLPPQSITINQSKDPRYLGNAGLIATMKFETAAGTINIRPGMTAGATHDAGVLRGENVTDGAQRVVGADPSLRTFASGKI